MIRLRIRAKVTYALRGPDPVLDHERSSGDGGSEDPTMPLPFLVHIGPDLLITAGGPLIPPCNVTLSGTRYSKR